MKRSLAVLFVVTVVLAGARALAEGPTLKVEVAGVRTVFPSYKDEFSMHALNSEEGFTLGLLLEGDGIIAADGDASKIAAIKDDKGTNLALEKGWNKPQVSSSQISKDAKACLVEVKAPVAPARGAKSVHVEATVVVVTANGTEKKEGPIVCEKGQKIEFGNEPLVLANAQEVDWNKDYPFGITFTSKKPLHWIASLSAKDEDGKEIKCNPGGGGWSASGNDKTYEITVQLAKKIKKGTLVIEVRKDLKAVDVPVALDVSIGG